MTFLSLLTLLSSFNTFCGNMPSNYFNSLGLSEIFKSSIALTCSFVVFFKFFLMENK